MPTPRTVVLVVDDEPLIRWSLGDDLRDQGFHVLEASDADEAIATIMGNPEIEAIVTDIDMPGTMDGFRLAAFVRGRWPSIRIIVTSGNWTADNVSVRCCERFVAKPYDPKVVARAIRETIAAL